MIKTPTRAREQGIQRHESSPYLVHESNRQSKSRSKSPIKSYINISPVKVSMTFPVDLKEIYILNLKIPIISVAHNHKKDSIFVLTLDNYFLEYNILTGERLFTSQIEGYQGRAQTFVVDHESNIYLLTDTGLFVFEGYKENNYKLSYQIDFPLVDESKIKQNLLLEFWDLRGKKLFYNREKRLVIWWASKNELLTICCTLRAVSPLSINFDKKVKNRV